MFLCVFLFLLVFLFSVNLQNNNLVKSSFSHALNSSFFFFRKNSVEEELHVLCFSVSFCFSIILSYVFHVVLSKMTSFPLHFLLLFIIFPSVLSLFCLFLFSRFFHLSLPYFILLVSLLSLCFFMSNSVQKNCIFLNFCKTLFFCLLFSVEISVFSVSFFCWAFLRPNYFSMFCFSVSWKMVSHFVWLSFFFDSSGKLCFFFLLSFFLMYPRIKKVVFWWKWWKLSFVFCFCSLVFLKKTMCARANPLYFPLFLKLLESFSLFTSKHRKTDKKKPSFFVFVQSPFWLIFSFNIFPFFFSFITVVFVHFFLSSFCSSLFAFLSFFLSLFSPSFFLYLSVSLPPFSSISCFLVFFSIAVLCIFFWIDSFYFSLLFLISFFFFSLFFLRFRILSFMSNQIQKILLFFEEDCFLNNPFFCVLSRVFPHCVVLIPCLFHVFWIFERFLKLLFSIFFLSIFVSGLFEKLSLFLDTTFKKYHWFLLEKLLLEKTLVFVILTFFGFDLFSSCMIFNFSFFLSFSCKYFLSFVLISLFLFKKKTSKNKLIPLYFCVYSPCSYSSWVALSLSSFLFSLFFSVSFLLFCLFMFPLLMFNCSSYVYLFSLMSLLFVFIPFFLHCSSLFKALFF